LNDIARSFNRFLFSGLTAVRGVLYCYVSVEADSPTAELRGGSACDNVRKSIKFRWNRLIVRRDLQARGADSILDVSNSESASF